MALLTKKVDSTLNAETFTPPSKAIELKVPDFLMALPVQDDESFCHLNDNLNDSINRQLMIQFLAGIGGKDARSTTTNLLRRILLDEVAEQYSLTGKQMKNSKKKSFLATNVCKVLFHMCKKSMGTTEAKFNEITGDWLNQAKIRIMRRAERRKKLAPTSIEETN